MWICVVIGIIVFGAMIFSIIMHRKSRGHEAAKFDDNLTVEIVWTIVPFIILLFAHGNAFCATWIVDDDGGPGVDFTDIPPAIAAASTDDLILVRMGNYSGFVLDKGLVIAADTGHAPSLDLNSATIKNIGKSRSVRLAGFSMLSLVIRNCDGPVQVDDCEIGKAKHTAALIIDHCSLVTVTRTSAIGRNRPFDLGPGGGGGPYAGGGAFVNATVILSECYFKGGYGSGIYKSGGTDGMDGITITSGKVFIQSTTVVGGRGGDAWDPFEFFGDGGDGAPGIRLDGSYLELFGLDTHYVSGGPGGMGDVFTGMDGEDANAVFSLNSTIYYSGIDFKSHSKPTFGGSGSSITKIAPDVPVLTTNGPGQLGSLIQLQLSGPDGSGYVLFLSPFTATGKMGNLLAHMLLDPGTLFLFTMGTVPAGGKETFDLQIPLLPSLQGLPANFQAYMKLPSTNKAYLSTSAGFVIR